MPASDGVCQWHGRVTFQRLRNGACIASVILLEICGMASETMPVDIVFDCDLPFLEHRRVPNGGQDLGDKIEGEGGVCTTRRNVSLEASIKVFWCG